MAYTGYSRAQQAGLYYARKNRVARLLAQQCTPWSSGLTISAAGLYVTNVGLVFQSLGPGVTGSAAPTISQGQVSDGNILWQLTDFRSLLQYLYSGGVPTPPASVI